MQALHDVPRERAEWIVWIDMDVILGDIGFTFPLTKEAYEGKDLVVWGNYNAVMAGDTYNGAPWRASAAPGRLPQNASCCCCCCGRPWLWGGCLGEQPAALFCQVGCRADQERCCRAEWRDHALPQLGLVAQLLGRRGPLRPVPAQHDY